MSDGADRPVPRQRTKDLVIRAHAEGTLILDRRTETAHYLPSEVTRVWAACTGRNTLAEIASTAGIDEQIAASAVDQLLALDLLENRPGIDRRVFLRRSALVGAGTLTIPVIETVVAAPAWAQTTENVEISTNPPPTCSTQMNTGANRTTLVFQLSLNGFPQGDWNGVLTALSPNDFATWRIGGGNAPNQVGMATFVETVAAGGGEEKTETFFVAGPLGYSSNSPNQNNYGPLFTPFQFRLVLTPAPGTQGTPVDQVFTIFPDMDEPCCPPPGCIKDSTFNFVPMCDPLTGQAQFSASGTGWTAPGIAGMTKSFRLMLPTTTPVTTATGTASIDSAGNLTVPVTNFGTPGQFTQPTQVTFTMYDGGVGGTGNPIYWGVFVETIGPCTATQAAPLPRKATAAPPRQATPHPPPSTPPRTSPSPSPTPTPSKSPSTQPSSTAPRTSSSPSP